MYSFLYGVIGLFALITFIVLFYSIVDMSHKLYGINKLIVYSITLSIFIFLYLLK